ncbi:hypothetical protein K2173_023812 [Erythroxylum novogranatense]|uniref:Uncharacterized protein n=1 Tax=Erythroxylum novogranatense TaxID=1862640 RepID=A0AAV8TJV0_9ROSI|nr:hypothetical protein K2173_023812 [Erythroxylum novogranatense]
MALKWCLNSSFTQVLGLTDNSHTPKHHGAILCPTGHHGHVQDCVKSLKEGDKMVRVRKETCPSGFQMPLHYPKYNKAD